MMQMSASVDDRAHNLNIGRFRLGGRPGDDVELDRVSLLEGFKTFALDGAVMGEDIRAGCWGKKSETLCVVEPRYFTRVLRHDRSPFRCSCRSHYHRRMSERP